MKALKQIIQNLIKPSLEAEKAYQKLECRKRVNLRKVSNAYYGG
ncbi:MAG: hypothetical protein ACJARO_000858 [Bacteriovoracaceae bacterium]|jgi:hypothetical protein